MEHALCCPMQLPCSTRRDRLAVGRMAGEAIPRSTGTKFEQGEGPVEAARRGGQEFASPSCETPSPTIHVTPATYSPAGRTGRKGQDASHGRDHSYLHRGGP